MKIYRWRFDVRSYEMDAMAKVRPSTLLNYLEEGSWRASAVNGYDPQWYEERHRIWVIRKMTVRYHVPVTRGDELELNTWVADFRRVQSHREYDLRRVSDNEQVVRARGNWVFLDSKTMLPERIPDEVHADFEPTGVLDELDAQVIDPVTVEKPVIHTEERRVERRDLDSVGHVNNAVYLAWADQALTDALRAAGWPSERFASADFVMRLHSDEIEYFRGVWDNDPIRVVTRLAQVGRDRAAWEHEIRHAVTDELTAKVVSVRAFRDADGPRSIPDALHLSLLEGTQG